MQPNFLKYEFVDQKTLATDSKQFDDYPCMCPFIYTINGGKSKNFPNYSAPYCPVGFKSATYLFEMSAGGLTVKTIM